MCAEKQTNVYKFIKKLLDTPDDGGIEILKQKFTRERGTKAETYKQINPLLKVHQVYETDIYIDERKRIMFTRFRLSSHDMKIETGRWARIDREKMETGRWARIDREKMETGRWARIDREKMETGRWARIDREKMETGRWARIDRENRLCYCGEIQDEYHVLFNCIKTDDIRSKYSVNEELYNSIWDLMNNYDTTELVNFIYECLQQM